MEDFREKNHSVLRELALKLYVVGAVKFGDFESKSGLYSPVHLDMKIIVSYPSLLEDLSVLLVKFMTQSMLKVDQICPMPYSALPIATIMSIKSNIPMLITRKEEKSNGPKELIEGCFKANDQCLIVDDVLSHGPILQKTVEVLKEVGIVVTDAVVVLNLRPSCLENMPEENVKIHALFTLSQLLDILQEEGKIDKKTVKSIESYLLAQTCTIL